MCWARRHPSMLDGSSSEAAGVTGLRRHVLRSPTLERSLPAHCLGRPRRTASRQQGAAVVDVHACGSWFAKGAVRAWGDRRHGQLSCRWPYSGSSHAPQACQHAPLRNTPDAQDAPDVWEPRPSLWPGPGAAPWRMQLGCRRLIAGAGASECRRSSGADGPSCPFWMPYDAGILAARFKRLACSFTRFEGARFAVSCRSDLIDGSSARHTTKAGAQACAACLPRPACGLPSRLGPQACFAPRCPAVLPGGARAAAAPWF